MAIFPVPYQGGSSHGPTTSLNTAGGVATVSSSTNAKGSYSTVRVTSFDCDGFLFSWCCTGSNNRQLLDVAVGAAGSEQIIVADLHYGATANVTQWMYIPYSLPAGSTIRVRHATSAAASAAYAVTEIKGGWAQSLKGCSIATYGATAADSGGISMDAGATNSTYGAIVQVVASTTYPIKAIAITLGANANTATTIGRAIIRVMVGASGSEVPILDLPVIQGGTAIDNYGPAPDFWFPVNIPQGSRISARMMSTVTDATDRICDIVVHGLEA